MPHPIPFRQSPATQACQPPDTSGVTRRRWVQQGLAAMATGWLGSVLPAGASSQNATPWPNRPLQLIVPWPAGGATDLTLRLLCEEAEPLLGQRIVVANKPGAAGTLVAPALKAAAPDGYTIGQVPITVYRHALMNHVAWDPVTDLEPIVQVSGVTFGVLVPTDSPWKTLADLVAWAKANPKLLLLGSTGVGTTAHLAMEDVLQQHGIQYTHVPYKGTADQMLAIASGQIMAGVNSTGFAPWVDQGKMRLLAIFSAQRSSRWPEVPTLRELGYPNAVHTSPWGLAAPAGTPEPIIRQLHNVFRQAMHTERHQQALARYDQALSYLDTAAYRQSITQTVARERQLLKRINLLASPAGN
ncbi:MAG TPA: tripartite tricarboxylate transporter substrate binding protein [Burkholderiaceae bacterium]|nr:tripartite tricarboxylate transporter substrate binding protein [Burkholderiaceae bacterium]